MNEIATKDIITSVKDAYNTVSVPFVASRKQDWSEFEIITSHIHPFDTILDAGCAHGRLVPTLLNYGVRREKYTGIDISEKLIAIAQKQFPDMEFDIGDVCNLPYEDNCFDVVIASAVLHHIPSKKLRIQMIDELVRVAKPDGKVIVLVWNAFHFDHLWKSISVSYLKSFFTLGKHEAGDMYLPFFGKETKRYVHAFTKRSLEKLFRKSLGRKIEVQNTGKNFLIIFQKTT